MTRSIFLSLVFHTAMIVLTAISLPLMMRTPIDLPPIISVELIEISDKTNIPFAPKAREILKKIKEKKKNSFRTGSSSCQKKRETRQNSSSRRFDQGEKENSKKETKS